MSADNIANDISDSPSCRIVVISALLERAADLLLQIQTLSTSISSKRRSQVSDRSLPPPIDVANLTNSSRIPWIISNKYYTAPVHYLVHTVNGLAPHLLKDVPAIIYVWKHGDDYKHHIQRIAQDIGGSQPEVALAVRLPAGSDASGAEDDDASEVDDFLSSNGFEFIDVVAGDGNANVEDNTGFTEHIPSLPRVLDALGTIMWPSMQSAGPLSTSKTQTQKQALLDWTQSGSFDLNEEDMIVNQDAAVIGPAQQLRAQKQLDDFARWLEEDDTERKRRAKDDPWQSADAEGDEMVGSPADLEFPESHPTGFDDDFTVFVSAPPAEPTPLNIPPSNTFGISEDSSDADALTPLRSAPMYHSLGSQSDLGDISKDMDEVEADELEDSDDSDEDFPTKAEIRESAVKIFGPFEDSPDLPETFSFSDNGEDLAPFDLTRVLGALEGIKAEIAGLENEDERRRAAAKVALGLVHGLERAPTTTS